MIMLGSNNYLGLTSHPKVKEAAIEAVKKYGSGCAGSRFLNGTLDIHVKLEEKLASFFRKDAALTFSTGYQTNLGIISSLAGKDDVVVIDKLDHASIIDACRLSFAEVKKFKHNDMDSLEYVLQGSAGTAANSWSWTAYTAWKGTSRRSPTSSRSAGNTGRGSWWTTPTASACWARPAAGRPSISASKRKWTSSWAPTASPWRPSAVSSLASEDVIHYIKHTCPAPHFLRKPAAGLGGRGHRGAGHHRPGTGAQGAAVAQHAQDDEGLQADGLRHRGCRDADHPARHRRDGAGVHDVEDPER